MNVYEKYISHFPYFLNLIVFSYPEVNLIKPNTMTASEYQ
jgi:hypothetical protein